MKMFCKQCGKEMPEGAAFCENCGAKTDGVQAPQPVHDEMTIFRENSIPQKPGKIINEKADPFIKKNGIVIGIILMLIFSFGLLFGKSIRTASFDSDYMLSGKDADDLIKLQLFLLDGDKFDYDTNSLFQLMTVEERNGVIKYITNMPSLNEVVGRNSEVKKQVSGTTFAAFGLGVWALSDIMVFVTILVTIIVAIVIGCQSSKQKVKAWKNLKQSFSLLIFSKTFQLVGTILMKLGTDSCAKGIYKILGKDEGDAYHLVKFTFIPVIVLAAIIAVRIIAGRAHTAAEQEERYLNSIAANQGAVNSAPMN